MYTITPIKTQHHEAAIRLYENVGFEHMDQPWPGTLHGGCDVWMVKDLQRL